MHDNEALSDALRSGEEVIPVYVLDERVFYGTTKYGFRKTGGIRARFILESLKDLRDQLRALNSDLYIRIGKPEEEIFKIAQEAKSSWTFCNRERTKEEVDVQDALERNLWSIGQEIRYSRGKMLYYTADLPFPVTQTPDVFTQFRKEVEKIVPIRELLPSLEGPFEPLTMDLDSGEIPTLEELNYSDIPDVDLAGGEKEGLKRLHYYLWETDCIRSYKDTRNELLGNTFSSKFSSYLSQGCLSPKMIYHEIKRYEKERLKNDSTYWLIFELMWRDFFRLMGKKHGSKIFLKGGPKERISDNIEDNMERFDLWKEGRTGVPFIDANMRELNATGFMSNRGRQNVASFLIHDLQVNWQIGAEYFESMLIDYDPCSNWGNWNYLAGIGSDPRENRKFNTMFQAKKYDPDGSFVKAWLPNLKDLPSQWVHQPCSMSEEEAGNYGFVLTRDYCKAIV